MATIAGDIPVFPHKDLVFGKLVSVSKDNVIFEATDKSSGEVLMVKNFFPNQDYPQIYDLHFSPEDRCRPFMGESYRYPTLWRERNSLKEATLTDVVGRLSKDERFLPKLKGVIKDRRNRIKDIVSAKVDGGTYRRNPSTREELLGKLGLLHGVLGRTRG